ncbi:MAG: GNAT family N-acetyltransferase [Jatrophihabitans sp.]
MPQRTLHTARITLVPLADEHLEHEIGLDSDPEVMRFLGSGRPRMAAEVAVLHLGRIAVPSAAPGLGFWVGFVDAQFVGWWLLEPPEPPDAGSAELGYRLMRRYWRRGLAGEGARELLRHGFGDLQLTRIFAETMAVNTASRATLVSLGMTCIRTFHDEWDEPIPGSEQGEVEYAITSGDWRRMHSGAT